uniref:Uncharacterized protein n=1 Tax=Amorphochlora amoebiformis TaxID=1561963 RepID=A0A7S0GUT4_9EUKA
MQETSQVPSAVPDYVHVCDPNQFSLTAAALPSHTNTANRANVPLGVVLQPLAETESEVPVINFGAIGVVRCKNCRAYMNPYVQWTEGGAHWRCNLCASMNETASGYYSPMDNMGRRADLAKRPELIHSTVEIVATPHYMIRAPMPCVYFFVIDVSKPAIESGMVARVCSGISAALDDLPGGKRTMVGAITYDSTVHFYSFRGGTKLRTHVLPDLEDIFLPEPRGLLVNLAEERKGFEYFLENLPQMFAETKEIEAALGPALEAAYEVMKPVGGKLSVFASTLPSIGKGRLTNRDDPTKLGKPDEHKLLLAADGYYKDLAFRLSHVQISVDVYLFSRLYTDVATLNDLAKYTGGATHHYPNYYDLEDGFDLHRLLVHSLTRQQGWEAVIRVRVGQGYMVTDFFGNFRLRSTDLLTVPCIDSDKSFALQLGLTEKGVTTPTVSVQSALLYTTSFGERRIRVHTICVPVTTITTHIYRTIHAPSIGALVLKQAIAMVTKASFDKSREHVRKTLTALIRSYSYTESTYSHAQQLKLPESLAAIPLMCLGLLKHEALRDKNVTSDQRASVHALMYPMGVSQIEISLRPRLLPIHQLDGKTMPQELELTAADVDSTSALLLDNGSRFLIRVGSRVDSKWVNSIFATTESKALVLRELDESTTSVDLERVHQILDSIRTPFHKGLRVIREGGGEEIHFFSGLIQDRSVGEQSLAEYMQFILRR